MPEPPRPPCAVRGLRWGVITDTACLDKMISYSLWMGEAHTPLACVAHALAQWHTSEHVTFLMSRLCTPTQLRAKYQEGAYECVVALLGDEAVEDTVSEAMRAAVRHGPLAQAAVHEAERESHVRAFLAAIYRRDVEMQLLLLCASWPHVPEQRAEPTPAHTQDTHTKSKRKAARTQRWQGFPTPFAWGTVRPAPASSPVKDLEVRADQPSLRALFDAYADQLCLLQLSAGLSSSRAIYGSDVRTHAPHDDRDEAQWFCADVVERYFEHLAPRMCATLRSKCFAPGPSLTPTRRRPWKRSSSAKPPPPPEPVPAPQEKHPLLQADRTARRSSLSSSRISNEVVMSRRLVRPSSLQRTSSAPLTTSMSSTMARTSSAQASKRQRTMTHDERSSAKTLVSATPERPPAQVMEQLMSPTSSPPTSPTGHRGEPLGADMSLRPSEPARSPHVSLQEAAPAWDRRSSSPSDMPRSRSTTQVLDAPSLAGMDDESDVELVIPSSRKAAMYIDPLSYIG
ncbi:hypothetical protein MCAP1_003265 [Malassezia caprae]|uniref:DNA replication regulator Sld3 C-terminal domain-containing protein n=1 Tax=Malassezia caprae TaxID=1381934 RepID=A0AAF0J1G8_9BASI|nr:hypothetical protein MCAP1_003265 [Malassezia caprae]